MHKHKKEEIKGLESGTFPYSPVVKVGHRYHFSGVIPEIIDKKPKSPGNVREQTRQVLEKIRKALLVCNLSPRDIYSVTIMMSSMDDFSVINEEYLNLFPTQSDILPRRKAFAVAGLPFGAMVEIEFDAIDQTDD